MNWIKTLPRVRLTLVVLVLASAAFMSAGIYHASAVQNGIGAASAGPSGAAPKQKPNEEVRRGVGSEVQFASVNDSPLQVLASVESVAGFIYSRSNLKMSDETKKKLTDAEQSVLNGGGRRISIDELTNRVTAVAIGRLAVLSDEDINGAAGVYATPEGGIFTRACGKWGVLSRDEFVGQLKSARELSLREGFAVQEELRQLVAEEVNDRVAYLSEALPNQFGRIRTDGLTPLQSLLIAYSVASDDPLAGSQGDLKEMMLQKRMNARQTRDAKKALKGSGKAYGINGALYSSPVQLLFNQTAINGILNPFDGKGNTK